MFAEPVIVPPERPKPARRQQRKKQPVMKVAPRRRGAKKTGVDRSP